MALSVVSNDPIPLARPLLASESEIAPTEKVCALLASDVQITFLTLPNHFFDSVAHSALFGGKSSWRRQAK
jgi:hypothetical protein